MRAGWTEWAKTLQGLTDVDVDLPYDDAGSLSPEFREKFVVESKEESFTLSGFWFPMLASQKNPSDRELVTTALEHHLSRLWKTTLVSSYEGARALFPIRGASGAAGASAETDTGRIAACEM